MRIIYAGSSGPLSVMPLETLLEKGHDVCAVVLANAWTTSLPHRTLSTLTEHSGSVSELARYHGIPVVLLDDGTRAMARMRQLAPEVILVSCFARRLPDTLLSLPAAGCFNLHPSLLPAWRGPDPLFWQFREGADVFGVSWHRMSSKMDAGAVVAQSRLTMPDGISARQAAVLLAGTGSGLLQNMLSALEQDTVDEIEQDERLASYRSFPRERDFDVSASWLARRLYNFICATRERGRHYPCEIDGRSFHLVRARSWQADAAGPPVISGNRISFSCNHGRLDADFM